MPKFYVEQREVTPEVQRLTEMTGPIYVVMNSDTGRSVPFGGYGEDWKRAQARADRENERVRKSEDDA